MENVKTSWLTTLDSFLVRIMTRLQEIYRERENDRMAVEFALRASKSSISLNDTKYNTTPEGILVDVSTTEAGSNVGTDEAGVIEDWNVQHKIAPMSDDERYQTRNEIISILLSYKDDFTRISSGRKVIEYSVTESDVEKVYDFLVLQDGKLVNNCNLDTLPWIWNWTGRYSQRLVHFMFDIIAIHEERLQRWDPKLPLVGFKNAGNSCYISSLLTAMFSRSSQYDYLLSIRSYKSRKESQNSRKNSGDATQDVIINSLINILFLIVHRMRQGRLIGTGTISLLKQELLLAGFFPNTFSRESQQDVMELYQWIMNTLHARPMQFVETLFHGGDLNPKEDQSFSKEFVIVLGIDDKQEGDEKITSSSFTEMITTSQRRLSSGIHNISRAVYRKISKPLPPMIDTTPSEATSNVNYHNSPKRSLNHFLHQHFFANRIKGLLRPLGGGQDTQSHDTIKSVDSEGKSRTDEVSTSSDIVKMDAWKTLQMLHDPFSPILLLPLALKRYTYESNVSPSKERSPKKSFLLSTLSPLTSFSSIESGKDGNTSTVSTKSSSFVSGTSTSGPKKDDKRIDIPLAIDFTPFISLHPDVADLDGFVNGSKIAQWRLQLKTAICHSGSTVVHEGHYTCYIRGGTERDSSSGSLPWLRMDDLSASMEEAMTPVDESYVRTLDFEEWNREVSRHCYLLFYELEIITEKQIQMEKDEELARDLQARE